MNYIIFKKNIITLFLLLTVLLTPLHTNAQQTRLQNPGDAPGTSATNALVPCVDDCSVEDFFKLIGNIINLIFIFAGFIVAIMFMYAGFLLITSAGDMSKIQKARTIFKRVVIGFLIMFSSFLLVKNILENMGLDTPVKNFFINIIQ